MIILLGSWKTNSQHAKLSVAQLDVPRFTLGASGNHDGWQPPLLCPAVFAGLKTVDADQLASHEILGVTNWWIFRSLQFSNSQSEAVWDGSLGTPLMKTVYLKWLLIRHDQLIPVPKRFCFEPGPLVLVISASIGCLWTKSCISQADLVDSGLSSKLQGRGGRGCHSGLPTCVSQLFFVRVNVKRRKKYCKIPLLAGSHFHDG